MKRLTLYNDGKSPIDAAFYKTTVDWLTHEELKLKRPVIFYLQGIHTDFDVDGTPTRANARGYGHDGTSWDNGTVQVAIEKGNEFPETWAVNPALPGGYINGIVELADAFELFVFLAAHELRHLWQWEQPAKAKQIRQLLKCDDETDADIFAIRMLSKYRNQ